MDRKKKSAFGVTFTGDVTFQGPMFDIHDNEHVHLYSMRAHQSTEADEEMEMNTDIAAPPEDEELNYFQPRLHLKKLLMMDWFELMRVSNKYSAKWRESLVDGLLESKWRDQIARDWACPRKRDCIRGFLMGILKDTGVLKGSYDSISLVAHITRNTRTFSRYMSLGKKQTWYSWVAGYVSDVSEQL